MASTSWFRAVTRKAFTTGSNKILILLLVTALAACAPQPPQTDGGLPISWFDAPLPGSGYDLVPIQLVSHHSGGVAELEFSVNGEVFETAVAQSNTSLVTDTREWTPGEPGEYILRIRARNQNGAWGDYAETYVLIAFPVGTVQGVVYADNNGNGVIEAGENPLDGVDVHLDGCGPAQVQTTASDGVFNFAGLPAGSCSLQVFKGGWGFSGSTPSSGYPIPVVSGSDLPTALGVYMAPMADELAEEAGFSDKGIDTNTVYTGRCTPNQVTFRVRAVHPDGIRGVTFFFRLQQNGEDTPWSNGQAMNPASNGFYQLTLTGNQLQGDSGFTQATVLYQFVIEPSGGQLSNFVRSQVYNDLTLLGC